MEKYYRLTKSFTMLFIGLLVGFGRFYNLDHVNQSTSSGLALFNGIYYGVFIAVMVYFLIDLIFAKGMITLKNRALLILTTILIMMVIYDKMMINDITNNFTQYYLYKSVLTAIFFIMLWIMDISAKGKYIYNSTNELPLTYKKRRPLKSLIELIFRLLPHAEPVGLYKVGNPTKDSPVYLTGNFELTIRRVVKALSGKDCWLLVADSRGINIWCATEAKHFGTTSVIEAINLNNLSETVDIKNIIVPQLLASNLDIKEVKEKTGFSIEFGPVNIASINLFEENKDNPEIREVTFNLKERIEVSFGSPIILMTILLLVFNFIGLGYLLVIVPAIYFINLIASIIYPKVSIKNIFLKAIAYGLIVSAVTYLIFYLFSFEHVLLYTLTLGLGIAYLTLEFDGWSPLIKFNYGYVEKAEIKIDNDLCIGCKKCLFVCPKAVFEIKAKKAIVADESACVLCGSCFKQCPVDAVIHSMDK